ncbi:Sin3 associated polypeptide p18-domain-containing protein [Mortierella sp. GBAus27b]|nr:Sin3 associated polypeptide p18-domain-containing protein [Mortierella sp. GBAus27b]
MADTQSTPTSAAAGTNPPGEIDREKLCPFLLRMYYSRGAHHRTEVYSPMSTPPQSSELRLYTWKNATLGEITSLVKQAIPDLVIQAGPGAQLSFRHMYLDIRKGVFVGRDIGKVTLENPSLSSSSTATATATTTTTTTTADTQVTTSTQNTHSTQDTQSAQGPATSEVSKEGLFAKDNNNNNNATAHPTGALATDRDAGADAGASANASASIGSQEVAPKSSSGSSSRLSSDEKTLASFKFVIGDYLDIAITSAPGSGVVPLPSSGYGPPASTRRYYNQGGGGPMRHQGQRGRGRGGAANPMGDRLAGRLGSGYNGRGHHVGDQRFAGLDAYNEPSWKRGRGR